MSKISGEGRQESGEPLGVDTVLNDLFGDGPKTRMLVVFLGKHRHDVNATELARLAGVDRSTVYRNLPDLLDLGVVRETRKVGNSPMYRLDRDHPAARKLMELEGALMENVEQDVGRDAGTRTV